MPSYQKPRDIINKKWAKNLNTKELHSQIEKRRKKINQRLKKLEESGMSDYSHAYKRIKDFIKRTYGTEYLPSGHKMKRKVKEEYLVRLAFYEESPLAVSEVRAMAKEEKRRIEASLSEKADRNIRLTWNRFHTFHYLLKKMREIGAFKNYGSDQLYTESTNVILQLTQERVDKFADAFEAKEFSSLSEIKDYFDNWNWEAGRSMEKLHITPGKQTEYFIDKDTEEVLDDKGRPAKIEILDNNMVRINGEVLDWGVVYDYILEHDKLYNHNS